MSVTIRIQTSPGEIRAVAVAEGRPIDYAIERPGKLDGVGALHLGRISRRASAMGGAFMRLAEEDGFLPDSEGAIGFAEGALIPVRIIRAAQGGKGSRLTARVSPKEAAACAGASQPRLVRPGPGAVERLAALHPGAEIVVDDAALAAALRPLFGTRLSFAPHSWPEDVATEIAALSEPDYVLPGEAMLRIRPTPALVAIDIDLVPSAGAEPKARAQEQANRHLIPEIARQIRLRNLSGAILIDFAGMKSRYRVRLSTALAAALAADPLRPRLLGFTAAGFAEILRPRCHPPLYELLGGPHAAALRALAALLAAERPGVARVLRLAPELHAALSSDEAARQDYARRTGRAALLVAESGLAPMGWRIDINA